MVSTYIPFLISLLLLAGCTSVPKYKRLNDNQAKIFEMAEKVRKESQANRGELAKAQDLYMQVIAENPKHSPSYLGLAKIMQRLGYYNGYFNYNPLYVFHSRKFIRIALEFDPGYVDAKANMAWTHLVLKEYEVADKLLKEALGDEEYSNSVNFVQALRHYYFREYTNAFVVLDKMISYHKTFKEKEQFLALKAGILRDIRQHDKAEAILLKIAEEKDNGWAWGNLAAAIMARRDGSAAKGGAERMIQYSKMALERSNFGFARNVHARGLIFLGRVDEALNMKWKGSTEKGSLHNYKEKMEMFRRFEPILGAIPPGLKEEMYNAMVVEADPKNDYSEAQREEAEKHIYASKVYSSKRMMNPKKALYHANQAIEILPNTFSTQYNKGLLYIVLKEHHNKAEKYLNSIDTKKFSGYEKEAYYLLYHNLFAYKLPNNKKLVKYLKKWAEDYPFSEKAHSYLYDEMYKEAKLVEQYWKLYEKWINEHPKNKVVHQWAYLAFLNAKKDRRLAEKHARISFNLDQKYGRAHYRLGFVEYENKNWDASLYHFERGIRFGLGASSFTALSYTMMGHINAWLGAKKSDAKQIELAKSQYEKALKIQPTNKGAQQGYYKAKKALRSIASK
tara:strand:- start:9374 stop:11233 length:1860 start_codon:yes stop_codon:yes gene_type:complete